MDVYNLEPGCQHRRAARPPATQRGCRSTCAGSRPHGASFAHRPTIMIRPTCPACSAPHTRLRLNIPAWPVALRRVCCVLDAGYAEYSMPGTLSTLCRYAEYYNMPGTLSTHLRPLLVRQARRHRAAQGLHAHMRMSRCAHAHLAMRAHVCARALAVCGIVRSAHATVRRCWHSRAGCTCGVRAAVS